MTIPKTRRALALLHDGLGHVDIDDGLEDLSTWVDLRRIPVPQPGSGQALVCVSHAAMNHSDFAFVKGLYGMPRVKGAAAGFEGFWRRLRLHQSTLELRL